MIGASGWLFKKKCITMHGNVNVECVCVCVCLIVYDLQTPNWGRICLNWAVAPQKKIPIFLDQKSEGKVTQRLPVALFMPHKTRH